MTTSDLNKAREQFEALRLNLSRLPRHPSVLIVEDDRNDSDHLKKKLHPFRMSLEFCRTSKEAIEQLKVRAFDVILLDLRLNEGGSGLDVLVYASMQKVKGFFIVLTGMDDHDPLIQEALRMGAVSAIRKPISDDHIKLIFGTIS
jgi:two-component system response regulator PilR (NtrC family)